MWKPRLALALAAAAMLALFSATETMVLSPSPTSFGRALLLEGPGWIAWALATPALIAWSSRFVPMWPPRWKPWAAHAAAYVVAAVGFAMVATICARAFGRQEPGPFARQLVHYLIGWSPFVAVAYVATVGLGRAAELAAMARERERRVAAIEAELVRAQLDALRMQLNPHFLFNALHTIAVMARDGDRAQAVELIAHLGNVLRRVLRTSPTPESPFADELSLLREYLEIEQVRFGERLRVEWRIGDGAARALVPPLILQPLVENALRHGLGPRAAPGRLTIVAARAADRLTLEVVDDGVGLRASSAGGIGLTNVRARLLHLYGKGAQLAVMAAPDGGVRARIDLPYRAAPEAENG